MINHCSRKKAAGKLLVKVKAMDGTPLVAGHQGPVARLVVISTVKFVPADAGQRTIICSPTYTVKSNVRRR
jgi:hypothetical protein